MLEWFIAQADYNTITGSPTADIERKGAIAYNGTVIDNVTMNIRGAGSQTAPKPNWKFTRRTTTIDFGLVEPVDEFGMQGDWSDKSHGRPKLSWDAYKRAGVMARPEQLFPMRTQRNARSRASTPTSTSSTGRGGAARATATRSSSRPRMRVRPERPLENIRFEKKNPNDGTSRPFATSWPASP